MLTVFALGPLDITVRPMLDVDPLLAALYRTPSMVVTPPVGGGRPHTILHPTDMRPAMLRVTLPPHLAPVGLARVIEAKVPPAHLAPSASGLQANMVAAEFVVALGALLVALVQRRTVVRAAPLGGHHVVARVAAAQAAGGGARAVQVTIVRGVGPGLAGAGDLGGAAGREARVLLAVERPRVALLGLVAARVAAAVGCAVRIAGVGAPRCAGGVGAAVWGLLGWGPHSLKNIWGLS